MGVKLSLYLQYLDAARGDQEGNADTDEGQTDEDKPRDDDASGEHGLPGWEPLLSEGSVVRPVRRLILLLYHSLGTVKQNEDYVYSDDVLLNQNKF